jgi:hypothetical protein
MIDARVNAGLTKTVRVDFATWHMHSNPHGQSSPHRKRLTIDWQAARLPLQKSVGLAFPKSDVGSQRLFSRGSLGASASVAGGTQSFHLSAQHNHSRSHAFVFLRGPGDCPINRPLVDKALKPFISSQAQHLFAAAGRVSLPQIEQDNFK